MKSYSIYKQIRLFFVALSVLLCFAHKNALARALNRDVDYYIYAGGGASFGGMNDSLTLSNTCNTSGEYICLTSSTGQSTQTQASNGFASNGGMIGMVGNLGIEFHIKNIFYVATELYGNVAFGTNQPSMYMPDATLSWNVGGFTNPNIGQTGVPPTSGWNLNTGTTANFTGSASSGQLSVSNGTNGYQGIFQNFKLGVSLYQERLAIYGIVGWGWLFSGLATSSQIYQTSNDSANYSGYNSTPSSNNGNAGTGNSATAPTQCTNCAAYTPGTQQNFGGLPPDGKPAGTVNNGSALNSDGTINAQGPLVSDGNTYYNVKMNVPQNGFAMTFGVGMNYYFTQNIGFTLEFISTIPFSQTTYANISNTDINNPAFNGENVGTTSYSNNYNIGSSTLVVYSLNATLNARF